MKILAPISYPDETENLIKAGADQLYCGLLPDEWKDKYTNIGPPNRREYAKANLTDWAQLRQIVDHASGRGVKVILTLNVFYSEKQYPVMMEYVEKAASSGVKELMVADIKLLLLLKERFPDMLIHISTVDTVFNSETVKFFKSLGAKRITLPRHLSLKEIKELIRKNPDTDFEIFVLNDACRNIDGFCTFHHGIEELKKPEVPEVDYRTNACYLNYDVTVEGRCPEGTDNLDIAEKIKTGFALYSGLKTCGACNLWEFKEWGVYGVKIAGRSHTRDSRVKDTRFIKSLLLYLEKEKCNREEFSEYAKKLFEKTYRMEWDDINLSYYWD